MISAILYTSNTGYAKRYAMMIGEKTGLPVYDLANCPVKKGAQIIYIGWVMASGVMGYKKANKKYDIKAVCGVCMGATGSQIEELRKQNGIPTATPLFTMQGGFDMNKLSGIYKFMMKCVSAGAVKGLSEKTDRTEDEEDMLNMMRYGADRVSEENITELMNWYNSQQ